MREAKGRGKARGAKGNMGKTKKIYTRKGDGGETSLIGGKRISKDSLRVEAYGNIDELNSFIGLAHTRSEQEGQPQLSKQLAAIQNGLFDIGSVLAKDPEAAASSEKHAFDEDIKTFEIWIDKMNQDLTELRSFVLPGGTELNSVLHICRTICRRAERSVIRLQGLEPVHKTIIPYLNRLGDLLFVMARFAAVQANAKEYIWEAKKLSNYHHSALEDKQSSAKRLKPLASRTNRSI